MSMINHTNIRTGLILLIAASAAMLLAGCKGQVEAPFGSTLTIETFGGVVYSGSIACKDQTPPNGAMTQQYKVSVFDSGGLPLNGAAVNLWGQIANGQNVNFGGKIESAGGTAFVIKPTDSFGFFLLDVQAPCFSQGVPLARPSSPTGSSTSVGGGLLDGTYFYTITAVDLQGETDAWGAISVPVTGATNTITGAGTGLISLSWPAVPGASEYNIYGYSSLSPGLGLLGTVVPSSPSINPVTWDDNGNWWPQSGIGVPGANTTGLSVNNVRGTIQGSTGAATGTLEMNF